MDGNKIKKLNNLQQAVSLDFLSLSSNEIEEIEPLKSLINLKYLNLADNQIENIEGFEVLKNLKELNISANRIKNIEYLRNHFNLVELNISHNEIETILALGNLSSQLTNLYITNNRVRDISIVSGLRNLERLDLRNNSISVYRPLEWFNRIKYIWISIDQVNAVKSIKNKRVGKINGLYKFLKSVFIISSDHLDFVDCELSLYFIRRNVHFNLYYWDQFDHFFAKCKSFDLEL